MSPVLNLLLFVAVQGARVQLPYIKERHLDKAVRDDSQRVARPSLDLLEVHEGSYTAQPGTTDNVTEGANGVPMITEKEHIALLSLNVSTLMLFFLFGVPLIVLMALSGGTLGANTLSLIQQISVGMMCIFWYSALEELLVDMKITGNLAPPLLHVCFLMCLSLGIGWTIQDSHEGKWFGIFVAFINIYTTYAAMSASGAVHPYLDTTAEQPFFVLVMFLFASAVYVLSRVLRNHIPGASADFHTKFDQCEMSLVKTFLAYSLMHAIAALLTGKVSHFQDYDNTTVTTDVHPLWQSCAMAGMGFIFLAASTVCPKPAAQEADESTTEAIRRWFLNVVGPGMFMCCGWGQWIALEWIFYGHYMKPAAFTEHKLGAAIQFSILIFVLCFSILFALDFCHTRVWGADHQSCYVVESLPTIMGTVVALTVKRPFDLSGDIVAPGFMYKLGLAVCSTCTLGLMWVILVRPRVNAPPPKK